MKKSDSYDFAHNGGADNLYAFATDNKIIYEVRFKPSGYLFDDDQPFVDSILEMVLLPVKADVEKEKLLDEKIPATVADILVHFFTQKEKVILYVCEDNDNRGAVRSRKFIQWFETYKVENIFKFNFTITDGKESYYNRLVAMKT